MQSSSQITELVTQHAYGKLSEVQSWAGVQYWGHVPGPKCFEAIVKCLTLTIDATQIYLCSLPVFIMCVPKCAFSLLPSMVRVQTLTYVQNKVYVG